MNNTGSVLTKVKWHTGMQQRQFPAALCLNVRASKISLLASIMHAYYADESISVLWSLPSNEVHLKCMG